MIKGTSSALEVSYDLRPAKQVERRMLIDTLQILAGGGFQIRDYQYTGLGAIYFVDFILFHKLLGIKKLLSAEHDKDIEKRVRFNKPFDPITIEMKPIGEVIPDLDRDLKHLLWLDYDFHLNQSVVADAALAAYHLSVASILLITVDVLPPTPNQDPHEWKAYYERHAEIFLEFDWKIEDFTQANLPIINARILFNAIKNGLAARPKIRFLPLFKFLYADGRHPMLSVGGMIGSVTEERMLNACDFSGATYLRRDVSACPCEIVVPKLTRKERLFIDRHMPCEDTWLPEEFEIAAKDIKAYRDIYRYYPAYAELLI
jgi:hypothetical protein